MFIILQLVYLSTFHEISMIIIILCIYYYHMSIWHNIILHFVTKGINQQLIKIMIIDKFVV